MKRSFLSFTPNRAVLFLVAFALTLGLLATATPSFAQGARLLQVNGAATASDVELDSEVVDPEKVFIKKTDQFPDHGNVLVEVQLSTEGVSLKAQEGKDFITLGSEEAQIIARDDGRGGDSVAGDGVFTALAFVDDAQMEERANEDSAAITTENVQSRVVFDGRMIVGSEAVKAFDVEGFLAGRRVELERAVVSTSESTVTEEAPSDTTSLSKGAPLSAIQAASNTNGVTNQFQERVLIIRDTGVVTDPDRTYNPCDGSGNPFGVWTFNHLMTEMANEPASGIDPSLFVEDWLQTWLQNPGPHINGFTASTRNQMEVIIEKWRQQSGGGQLDLAKSPLRLLAILPRLDLRTTTGGGGGYGGNLSGNFLDAGEARFVFGFVVPPEWGSGGGSSYPATNDLGFVGPAPIEGTKGCFALPFSVILEYRVPKCDCFEVRSWARQWIALNNYTPGQPAYNSRLERLTQQFVRANADPRRPNGSAIGQVRTNEVALPQDFPVPDVVWELREFQLTQKPFSLLEMTTTADTAHDFFNGQHPNFNGSNLLYQWIQIVDPQVPPPPAPPVPLFLAGQNFLGPNPQVPEPPPPPSDPPQPPPITYFWNHPNVASGTTENEARFFVSLAACSGCHRRETDTPFVHVDPSSTTLPATISGFLEGIDVVDPVDSAITRNFDDLFRREDDIKTVAKLRCFRFHPINVAHVRQSLQDFGVLPADLFQGAPVIPLDQRPALGVDDMLRIPMGEVH